MKKKIMMLVAVLTVMIAGTSSGERFNYTWKDAGGVLNITDHPPPENVEILEINVIPVPDEKQVVAPVVKKQDVRQNQSATRDRLLIEAASLKKEEAKLRLKATDLAVEAQELRRLSKKQRYKSSYRIRASNKERDAETLVSKADSLAGKVEKLEAQASQLK